jgi:hypothetical protein
MTDTLFNTLSVTEPKESKEDVSMSEFPESKEEDSQYDESMTGYVTPAIGEESKENDLTGFETSTFGEESKDNDLTGYETPAIKANSSRISKKVGPKQEALSNRFLKQKELRDERTSKLRDATRRNQLATLRAAEGGRRTFRRRLPKLI